MVKCWTCDTEQWNSVVVFYYNQTRTTANHKNQCIHIASHAHMNCHMITHTHTHSQIYDGVFRESRHERPQPGVPSVTAATAAAIPSPPPAAGPRGRGRSHGRGKSPTASSRTSASAANAPSATPSVEQRIFKLNPPSSRWSSQWQNGNGHESEWKQSHQSWNGIWVCVASPWWPP